jgi:hypothetical protein
VHGHVLGRCAIDQPPCRLADAGDPRRRLRHRVVVEGDRLPVVPAREEHEQGFVPPRVEHVVQGCDVADRLGHLLLGELQHAVVHPDLRELGVAGAARLGRLVLVVGEGEVVAAAVDLEPDAEQVLGHCRALDVPAGPAAAPRRVPRGVLAVLLGLPQREVERVLLAVGALDALALLHLVGTALAQRPVLRIGPHAEVDVPVDGVGGAPLDELGDQVDDRADRLRRERLGIGPAQAQAIGVGHVVRGHLRGERRGGDAGGACRVVDLVVDVRDVDHEARLVPLAGQEPPELAEDHEGPRVADVDARVDGRPAGVDANSAAVAGLEGLDGARAGVVESNVAHAQGH